MNARRLLSFPLALALTALGVVAAAARSVTITANHPNVVSFWNDVANRTIVAQTSAATTPEEQRAPFVNDPAAVYLAIYDAVVAIEGRYRPFAVMPTAPATGASVDAAIGAAAHGVLRAPFPNRAEIYQPAYDQRLAAIPDGAAKTRGVALGTEVAAGIVRLRADDGLSVALQPYVSGTAPGRFRAANPHPVLRHFAAMRPFVPNGLDPVRPAPPPALDSAGYAAAFNEVRSLGGMTSTTRTAEQLEIARFHTEPPPSFVTRNIGRLAASTADVVEAARLMAMVHVSFADAIGVCFETKYHDATWHPLTAIPLAADDGNDATGADHGWTPVLSTPNHPEYPAAQSCTSGALGHALRHLHGTPDVTFSLDSTVTATTRSHASAEAFNLENRLARIAGGMHFHFSAVAGEEIGRRVADWVAARHFGRQ
ncbi:vanadium-dependent haloperoxidase [Falsiroseomonas oryzae]|uniref:vanadium-dependent haloperoxidase n=1 Tax=Falsiroseomonas oryzae TaxID=2766473 RepID=UPI0022EA6CBF|nr:vanadium-dependent haloperoxidase [Roseomonas sp. MO-31]